MTADRYTEYVSYCPLPHTPTPENYQTKLITLSTCEYSRNNSRLVVVAKHITEDGGADAAKPHAEATAEGERPN